MTSTQACSQYQFAASTVEEIEDAGVQVAKQFFSKVWLPEA